MATIARDGTKQRANPLNTSTTTGLGVLPRRIARAIASTPQDIAPPQTPLDSVLTIIARRVAGKMTRNPSLYNRNPLTKLRSMVGARTIGFFIPTIPFQCCPLIH